jgi:glycine/D-amino acid oxidase-like deaminating enzyme
MSTISFWQRRNAAPTEFADIAVVGGGIVGVSTAFWLRRMRPELRVTIVDAGALASGASGRNAGFLLQGSASDFTADTRRYGADTAMYLWRFSGENRALVEKELDGARFDLARTGSLTVAGSKAEAERLLASVEALASAGESVDYLDAARLHERIGGAGFYGAMLVPAGGTVDSFRLVHTIAAASESRVLPPNRPATGFASKQWPATSRPARRSSRSMPTAHSFSPGWPPSSGPSAPRCWPLLLPATSGFISPCIRTTVFITSARCPTADFW